MKNPEKTGPDASSSQMDVDATPPTSSSDPPPRTQSEPPSSHSRETAGAPTAEEPGAATGAEPQPPKRRSSIRPAPADWQPPSQRRTPSPMVVVYSGDSDRPPPLWDSGEPSSRRTQLDFDLPAASEPFPPAESAVPPRVSMPSPAAAEAAPSMARTPEAPSGVSTRSPAPMRRVWLWPALALGALVTMLSVLAVSGLERTAPDTNARRSRARVAPDPIPVPVEEPSIAAARAETSARLAPASTSDSSTSAPVPSSKAPVTVKLDVFPPDARVLRRGVSLPGPPYAVQIPPGKRVAVEVTRAGFIPRRVVLDGTEPDVSIGLYRQGAKRRDPVRAPGPARAPAPTASVQSGL